MLGLDWSVRATRNFKQYLHGKKFLMRTEHAFKWLQRLQGRYNRLLHRLLHSFGVSFGHELRRVPESMIDHQHHKHHIIAHTICTLHQEYLLTFGWNADQPRPDRLDVHTSRKISIRLQALSGVAFELWTYNARVSQVDFRIGDALH